MISKWPAGNSLLKSHSKRSKVLVHPQFGSMSTEMTSYPWSLKTLDALPVPAHKSKALKPGAIGTEFILTKESA